MSSINVSSHVSEDIREDTRKRVEDARGKPGDKKPGENPEAKIFPLVFKELLDNL
jgi:hypothetical protein